MDELKSFKWEKLPTVEIVSSINPSYDYDIESSRTTGTTCPNENELVGTCTETAEIVDNVLECGGGSITYSSSYSGNDKCYTCESWVCEEPNN